MNKLSTALRNKKGFTLMEVIIVLIILAVLAAALIPTFLGFVQRAGHASAIAEARLGMTAAQAVLTDAVGRGMSDLELTYLMNTMSSNPTFVHFIRTDGIPNVTTDDHVTQRFTFTNANRNGTRVVGLVYNQGPGSGNWKVTITQADGAVVDAGVAFDP